MLRNYCNVYNFGFVEFKVQKRVNVTFRKKTSDWMVVSKDRHIILAVCQTYLLGTPNMN